LPIIGRSSIAALLLFACGVGVLASDEEPPLRIAVEFNNDLVFRSDNYYSSGVTIEVFGVASGRWEEARGTPAFGRKLARWLLPVGGPGLVFRENWAIGSVITTPEDLREDDPIEGDIPYSALLAAANGWVAFDDDRFAGFQFMFGVVGPAALGEFFQKTVHIFSGSEEPQGWENQLDNEPILNFTSMWKWKVWNNPHADGAINLDAAVGNWATLGDVSLEIRIGRRRPLGFLYVPDMLGRSMTYDATVPREGAGRSFLYGSLVFRATGIARILPADGSTFEDSLSVEDDRQPFAGYLIGGVHYRHGLWEVQVGLTLTTDLFEDSEIEGDERNRFGTIIVSRRF